MSALRPLVIAVLLTSSCTRARSASTPSQCGWSVASPVLVNGRPILVGRPTVAAGSRSTVVLGNTVMPWTFPDSVAPQGTPSARLAFDANGKMFVGFIARSGSTTLLTAPRGGKTFDFPAITAVDASSSIAVWGSRSDTASNRPGMPDSLFAASIDAAGWGQARRIDDGARMKWDPSASSGVAPIRGGVVVVAPSYDNDASPPWMGLSVIRLRGSTRDVLRVDEFSTPLYLTVGSDGDSHLVIVYTTTVRMSDSTTSFQMVSRESIDAGRTWRPEVLIRPDNNGDDWPHVHWARDGFHLAWVERGTALSTLHHHVLREGKWTELASQPFRSRISTYGSGISGGEDLFIVAQTDAGTVESTIARNGTWSRPELVPMPASFGAITVFTGREGRLTLAGQAAQRSVGGPPVYGLMLMTSEWYGSCTR